MPRSERDLAFIASDLSIHRRRHITASPAARTPLWCRIRTARSGVTTNAAYVPQSLPARQIPCLVAKKVGNKEGDSVKAAYDAMTAEADKLAKKGVRNLDKVKEWSDVCNNRSKNEFAHVGNGFGICMENGSELEKDNKGRYYKGRYVYQGNHVKDQNSNAVLFNEIGSSPAGTESSKAMDAFGLLPQCI